MAKHHELVGKRVEVHYRAGDVMLTAIGALAADSGKSIFIEETHSQHGVARSFRWEIPYPCIIRLMEVSEPVVPARSPDSSSSRQARAAFPEGLPLDAPFYKG